MIQEKGIMFVLSYLPIKPNTIKNKNTDISFYTATDTNKNHFKYIQNGSIDALKTELGRFTTGLFNTHGEISGSELRRLKSEANNGNGIYYGFFGIGKYCEKYLNSFTRISTFSKVVLEKLFSELGMGGEDLNVFCGVHQDRKSHFHVHFQFWERGIEKHERNNKTFPILNMIMHDYIDSYLDENVPCGIGMSGINVLLKNMNGGRSFDRTDEKLIEYISLISNVIPYGFRKKYDEIKSPELKSLIDRTYSFLIIKNRKAREIERNFYCAVEKSFSHERAKIKNEPTSCSPKTKKIFSSIMAMFLRVRREKKEKAGRNRWQYITESFYNEARNIVLSSAVSLRNTIDDKKESHYTRINDKGRKKHKRVVDMRTKNIINQMKTGFAEKLQLIGEYYKEKNHQIMICNGKNPQLFNATIRQGFALEKNNSIVSTLVSGSFIKKRK